MSLVVSSPVVRRRVWQSIVYPVPLGRIDGRTHDLGATSKVWAAVVARPAVPARTADRLGDEMARARALELIRRRGVAYARARPQGTPSIAATSQAVRDFLALIVQDSI